MEHWQILAIRNEKSVFCIMPLNVTSKTGRWVLDVNCKLLNVCDFLLVLLNMKRSIDEMDHTARLIVHSRETLIKNTCTQTWNILAYFTDKCDANPVEMRKKWYFHICLKQSNISKWILLNPAKSTSFSHGQGLGFTLFKSQYLNWSQLCILFAFNDLLLVEDFNKSLRIYGICPPLLRPLLADFSAWVKFHNLYVIE